MVMARKREKKEKDILDQINFKGLTQDEVVGQDGLIKTLTGKILQRALEAEMTEHLVFCQKQFRACLEKCVNEKGIFSPFLIYTKFLTSLAEKLLKTELFKK